MSEDSKVKITITGDSTGLSAAAAKGEESLHNLDTAAKQMAETHEHVAGAAAKAADAQHNLNGHEAHGSEIAHFLHRNHRALHEALELIGHEAGPAAGAALAGIGAAAGGGLTLAVLAVKELFEWLNKSKEAADKLAEAQAELWQSGSEARAEAIEDQRQYLETMQKILKVNEDITAEFAKQEAIRKAREEAQQKLLEHQEQLELAAAAAAGDKQREQQIRDTYAHQKENVTITGEAAAIASLVSERDSMGVAAGKDKAAADAAEADKVAHVPEVKAEEEENAKDIELHKKGLAKNQADLDEREKLYKYTLQKHGEHSDDPSPEAIDLAREKMEAAKKKLPPTRTSWRRTTKSRPCSPTKKKNTATPSPKPSPPTRSTPTRSGN